MLKIINIAECDPSRFETRQAQVVKLAESVMFGAKQKAIGHPLVATVCGKDKALASSPLEQFRDSSNGLCLIAILEGSGVVGYTSAQFTSLRRSDTLVAKDKISSLENTDEGIYISALCRIRNKSRTSVMERMLDEIDQAIDCKWGEDSERYVFDTFKKPDEQRKLRMPRIGRAIALADRIGPTEIDTKNTEAVLFRATPNDRFEGYGLRDDMPNGTSMEYGVLFSSRVLDKSAKSI